MQLGCRRVGCVAWEWVAELINTRQLIWVHTSANAYTHGLMSQAQYTWRITQEYDDIAAKLAQEALMRARIPFAPSLWLF